MNANHELTAQIAKMFAVLNLCHVSSENVPKQNEQNSVWGQHFFQIINVTNCSSDFEGIANELEATFAVLQGQQPRHSNPNPCCTSRFRAPTLLTGEEDRNAWLKEISLWSFGWTNHLNFNLTLVKTKRDKGINCSIDFCKLQSLWCSSGRNDGTQPYLC